MIIWLPGYRHHLEASGKRAYNYRGWIAIRLVSLVLPLATPSPTSEMCMYSRYRFAFTSARRMKARRACVSRQHRISGRRTCSLSLDTMTGQSETSVSTQRWLQPRHEDDEDGSWGRLRLAISDFDDTESCVNVLRARQNSKSRTLF